jgi:mono/diheme cytochrome c family protein
MNGWRALALTLPLTAALAACEPGADSGGASTAVAKEAAGGDVAKGKDLFSTCATCHGLEAEGVKGLGKTLKGNDFVKSSSTAELVAMINAGRPADDPKNTTGILMPPKGGNAGLTDEDVAHIVAYLKSIQ